jgi:hypothetical protein
VVSTRDNFTFTVTKCITAGMVGVDTRASTAPQGTRHNTFLFCIHRFTTQIE